MTLYNYVADREALEALIVDAVVKEARLPAAGRAWDERVLGIGLALAEVVRAHPNVAPLALTRSSMSAESLQPAEALLDALAASGRLEGADLLAAFRAVLAVVMGVVQAEVIGPAPHRRGEAASEAVQRFSTLDGHEFPRLKELAVIAQANDQMDEVAAALRLVIAGIRATKRI